MRKLFLVLLCSTLLFSGVAPISAETQTSKESSSESEKQIRENLKMIVEKDDYLEYTYQENGESYKVKEEISENVLGTNISSVIYKKNKNNKYVKDSSQQTKYSTDTSVMEIETFDKNNENVERQTLQLKTDDKMNKKDATNISPYNHDPDWTFVGTFYYDSRIKNLTIAAISVIIGNIVPLIPVKVVSGIAAAAYAIYAENLYYKVKEWGIYYPGTIIPAGKEEHVWIYTDKYRKNLVPNQGHWPKAIIRNYPKP